MVIDAGAGLLVATLVASLAVTGAVVFVRGPGPCSKCLPCFKCRDKDKEKKKKEKSPSPDRLEPGASSTKQTPKPSSPEPSTSFARKTSPIPDPDTELEDAPNQQYMYPFSRLAASFHGTQSAAVGEPVYTSASVPLPNQAVCSL